MNGDTLEHTPVLLNEVIRTINPQSGKLYFDATFGWGGYTKKLLDSCACEVIAIDHGQLQLLHKRMSLKVFWYTLPNQMLHQNTIFLTAD